MLANRKASSAPPRIMNRFENGVWRASSYLSAIKTATSSAPRSFRTTGKPVIGGGDGHIVGTNTRIALGAGGESRVLRVDDNGRRREICLIGSLGPLTGS
jgi:hypothetical protein